MSPAEDERPRSAIPLLLSLTATYGAGFVAWLGTAQGLPGWYPALTKPVWSPPPWVFAPVWTVLYAMMGVAAWLVWQGPVPEVRFGAPAEDRGRDARATRIALILFGVQLVLNALWTWLFFGWGRLLFASVEIAVLLVVAASTTWAFGRVRSGAAWLMVPYLGWLAFATALSFASWRLNS